MILEKMVKVKCYLSNDRKLSKHKKDKNNDHECCDIQFRDLESDNSDSSDYHSCLNEKNYE